MASRHQTPRITQPALLTSLLLVLTVYLGIAFGAQAPQAKRGSDSTVGIGAPASTGASTTNGSATGKDSAKANNEAASAALVPVVYNDDEVPGRRGYQYTFFGNAFFIHEDGYLLTVAHVLETFGNGGQPYILVERANAPPSLVPVTVIATDPDHDVAILRARPNPFAAKYAVSFVPLSSRQPVRGEAVLALSLRPKQAQNAHSFELPREDSSPGTVLSFEATQLAKSGPAAEVFLLSHPVVKGQSGSPVLDTQTQAVVGLVEGLWLRGSASSVAHASTQPAAVPGAAIPIQYAITLLKQNAIPWHAATLKDSAAPRPPSHP